MCAVVGVLREFLGISVSLWGTLMYDGAMSALRAGDKRVYDVRKVSYFGPPWC